MANHDQHAYDSFKLYIETGYESYLLKTCLCLMPLAQSIANKFHLKSFDSDAAINDCFSETFFSLKREKKVPFNSPRKLWDYYYKKYLCVCKRYINRSIDPPVERDLELEDVYRINYIFSRPSTVKDVEDRIFLEEELPALLRKEFKTRLRFEGEDGECCLMMLENALAGKKIAPSRYFRRNTEHPTRLLRDYTRVLIRNILYSIHRRFIDSLLVYEKIAIYYDSGNRHNV